MCMQHPDLSSYGNVDEGTHLEASTTLYILKGDSQMSSVGNMRVDTIFSVSPIELYSLLPFFPSCTLNGMYIIHCSLSAF